MWQVTNIIGTSAGGGSPVNALVAFPKPAFLLGPPALGHIRNVALLQLLDGTVWMLVLRGQVWSGERLHAAAEALQRVSRQAFTKSSIEKLLRRELAVTSVSLEPPVIARADIRQWDIDKVAFVLVRQRGTSRSAIDCCDSRKWAARSDLEGHLDEALRRFVDGLDPQALRASTRGRHIDLRIYNYLAHREYRQYRMQFAQTFPGLLTTAIVAEPRSFGEELRSIVDSGAPLIKGLAARWNVRSGVIRHLVGRASGDIGIQWVRDAKGLALALNALHPQDLPGDGPAEWREFNRIVATAQRLFIRPLWESSAALEWLRECMRRVRRKDKEALAVWLPEWSELARIDQLRAALSESVQRGTAAPPRLANDVGTSTADALDNAVLKLAHRGLNELASLFAAELERAQKKGSLARHVLAGEALVPLVPEDFVSSDGSTRVVPLTTSRQLHMHGSRMRNCLRYTPVRQVAREGPVGTVFIVGIYDAHSGKALSTAEIRTVANRKSGANQLITKQHTATANRKPSPRCFRVLQEFLVHCRTDAVRQHLEESWKKLGRARSESGRQPVNLPATLRCALGEQVYAEMLGSVRDTSDRGNAGAASM